MFILKKKNIFWIFAILILMGIVVCFFVFFKDKGTKTLKIGNNSSSQEIVDYILNISSYEATIEVEIQSNKNNNQYKMKQTYIAPDVSTQEVIEPNNIAGIKMKKEGNKLTLENSNLNLVTTFENYPYMMDNCLDLNHFIENYQKNEKASYREENNQIIMETTSSTNNKYQKNEKLYVDRNTGKPTKMEIKDTNQNTLIYILYNEVKISNVDSENVLAFQLYDMAKEI